MAGHCIEVTWPQGGFAFYPNASQAVRVMRLRLLQEGYTHEDIDRFAVFLQAVQDSGLMRSFAIPTGHIVRTGR